MMSADNRMSDAYPARPIYHQNRPPSSKAVFGGERSPSPVNIPKSPTSPQKEDRVLNRKRLESVDQSPLQLLPIRSQRPYELEFN